jgi:hypothetical protein
MLFWATLRCPSAAAQTPPTMCDVLEATYAVHDLKNVDLASNAND